MATTQILVKIPDELARRLRQRVPPRQRSAFVRHLLEAALLPEHDDDDPLYQVALLVERDEQFNAEMSEWESTLGDGLERLGTFERS